MVRKSARFVFICFGALVSLKLLLVSSIGSATGRSGLSLLYGAVGEQLAEEKARGKFEVGPLSLVSGFNRGRGGIKIPFGTGLLDYIGVNFETSRRNIISVTAKVPVGENGSYLAVPEASMVDFSIGPNERLTVHRIPFSQAETMSVAQQKDLFSNLGIYSNRTQELHGIVQAEMQRALYGTGHIADKLDALVLQISASSEMVVLPVFQEQSNVEEAHATSPIKLGYLSFFPAYLLGNETNSKKMVDRLVQSYDYPSKEGIPPMDVHVGPAYSQEGVTHKIGGRRINGYGVMQSSSLQDIRRVRLRENPYPQARNRESGAAQRGRQQLHSVID